MKKNWKKLLVLSAAAGLLAANISAMADQTSAESRKLSVLSVEGDEAYVVRGSVREIKATAGIPLGQGSRVRTGEDSSMYLEADDDKIIKLGDHSQAEITKASAKKLKLTLKSGDLFFNVDKPLKADEELRFDAAQTSMSIRGTSGFLQFDGDAILLYLLEGHVDWTIGNETVSLNPGEGASVVRGTGDQLSVSSMNSAYTVQSVAPFDWKDLDESSLRTLLENRDRVDLSAIGLGHPEAQEEAEEKLAQMEQTRIEEERRAAEEAEQAEREYQAWMEREEERERQEAENRNEENGSWDGGVFYPDEPDEEVTPDNPEGDVTPDDTTGSEEVTDPSTDGSGDQTTNPSEGDTSGDSSGTPESSDTYSTAG